MKIARLSDAALENILKGKTKEPFQCVIKFYSNNCHYCHDLKEEYEKIADSFGNVHFFAFNTEKHPNIDDLININGVPTIAFVKVKKSPSVSILEDPKKPHDKTWYYSNDIIDFIKGELNE